MDNIIEFIDNAADSSKVAFELKGLDATYANFILHLITRIVKDYFVVMIVYAYFMQKMKLMLLNRGDWHSITFSLEDVLAPHMFWPRLLRRDLFWGTWAMLMAFITFNWDVIMDLGLTFEPTPIPGHEAVSCLVWGDEGPESLGDVLQWLSKTYKYEYSASEVNTSVGSGNDKELLRRSIAEGSFDLFKLPTLTGGIAIENSGFWSPRDYYYGKEGLLTFYKSTGVRKNYNESRRKIGDDYGGHTVYWPTNPTFGSEEKVAIIHGIGSINTKHNKRDDTCLDKLRQLADDALAQGTGAVQWDHYRESENCTATLIVSSEDLRSCTQLFVIRGNDTTFTHENLIGAVKIFSNDTKPTESNFKREGKSKTETKKHCNSALGVLFENDARLVLVKTNKTEDHTMMDPYVRALARDAYVDQFNVNNPRVNTPERLTDRDATRLTRMLADIMSDQYRYRQDFCREVKIVVQMGFGWIWVGLFSGICAFLLLSSLIVYVKGPDTNITIDQLKNVKVWFEAGQLDDGRVKEPEFKFNEDPSDIDIYIYKVKTLIHDWRQVFRKARDSPPPPPENSSQLKFRLEGNSIKVKSDSNLQSTRESVFRVASERKGDPDAWSPPIMNDIDKQESEGDETPDDDPEAVGNETSKVVNDSAKEMESHGAESEEESTLFETKPNL